MTQEELIELLGSYEWRDIEFKEARRAVPQSAYETVSAFANTEGGRLVFGVRESGGAMEIVGVLDVDKVQSDFLNTLRQRNKISVLLPVREQIKRHKGNDLLIFHVPEAHRSDKPVFLDGDIRRAFVRSGGSDVRLTDAERDRFLVDAASERYDNQTVDLDADRAFDPESLGWYRASYELRPENRSWRSLNDVDFLREMGLLDDEGGRFRPTRAAILLFGKGGAFRRLLPRPVVDCQRFGVPRDEIAVRDRWFDRMVSDDNLIRTWRSLFEDWYPKFAEHPFRVDPRTLQREDTPPDFVAIREAMVNLLMHQDYSDHGRNAEILHYPDRIVFRNPGDAFIPQSDLLEPGEKEQRNPQIVLAFRRIGFSENAGWGLRDVFGNWSELNRPPPRIRNSRRRKRFELTLELTPLTERQQAFERRLGVRLDDTETRMLDYAARQGSLSVAELQVVAGVTGQEARRAASGLATQGLFERDDGGRFGLALHLREKVGGLGHSGSDQVGTKPSDMVSDQVTKSASGDDRPPVSGRKAEKATNRQPPELTPPQQAILDTCEVPRSLAELMDRIGATHRTFFRRTHLQPLLDAGIVRMTNPDNPRAANQRYVLTEAGAAIRAERLWQQGTGTP